MKVRMPLCKEKEMKKWQKKYKLKMKAEGKYNRGNRAAQSARYRQVRRIAVHAQRIAGYARKKGILVKPEVCSICGIKTNTIHAHHADYMKPLDVTWVCQFCHNWLHTIGGDAK